jgi:hypothetical protein
MDADEKPMVVVECVISNNPVQALHLRYTKGAAKKDYEVVRQDVLSGIPCVRQDI